MTAHGPKILKTTNQTVPKVHILHTSSLHDQKITTILYFVKLPTWSVSRNVGHVHAELFPRGWHAPQTAFNLVPYQSLGLRSWVSFLLSMKVSCWLVPLAHAQYLLMHAGIWRTTHWNDNIFVQVLIPISKLLMTFKTVSMSSIQCLLNLLKNQSSYYFRSETKCLFGLAGTYLLRASSFREATLRWFVGTTFAVWYRLNFIMVSMGISVSIFSSFSFEYGSTSDVSSLNRDFFMCSSMALVWKVWLNVLSRPQISHHFFIIFGLFTYPHACRSQEHRCGFKMVIFVSNLTSFSFFSPICFLIIYVV